MAMSLNVIAIVSAIFLAIGKWDRIAAFLLWYILTSLFCHNPLILNPSMPFVGWLLLAHLFVPKAPFGSLAAKDRLDPGGGWVMPRGIFFASWALLAISYTYSGVLKLDSPSWIDGTAIWHVLQNPLARPTFLREALLHFPEWFFKLATWSSLFLEVSFVFLALFRRVRPWAWLAIVMMHLGILLLVNFADLTVGMLMVHLFTFNPNWIKPDPIKEKLFVLYDGSCGFCHGFIKFILSENKNAFNFRFSPLQDKQANTIVVKEGEIVLTKSQAVIRVLKSLGGYWKVLGFIISFIPTRLCDAVYSLIARVRHRLFRKPEGACPVMPKDLRIYFE